MARYIGPACKLCRREGVKLFLKGERCTSGKCALDHRKIKAAPGQHGAANKKQREYGMQLREKQKAKRYYGVLEGQFKSYFVKADKQEGVTGSNLISLLERRLDNVVYRMGMAESHKEARQLVLHGHFRVNGKKVTIPSILVKVGDVITVREESRDSVKFKELIEALPARAAAVPKWLAVNAEGVIAKVERLPAREDLDFELNEQLIVELYSK